MANFKDKNMHKQMHARKETLIVHIRDKIHDKGYSLSYIAKKQPVLSVSSFWKVVNYKLSAVSINKMEELLSWIRNTPSK